MTYVHLNDVPLSAANAFGMLALFNVLRFPLMELGQILSVCTQAFIALQRIAKFVFQSETGVIGALKIKQKCKFWRHKQQNCIHFIKDLIYVDGG